MIRMTEAEALAAGIPFPSTPADEAERERLEKRRKRASGVALGKVAMNARERAKVKAREDKTRGWRVLVPSSLGSVVQVVGVDPGSRGGWVRWVGGGDRWHIAGVGDGHEPDINVSIQYEPVYRDYLPALVVLEGQTGFRYTGKRGTNVSEHTAGRNWGHAAGMLDASCRYRGWPMIVVEPRTWQGFVFPRWAPEAMAARWNTKRCAEFAVAQMMMPGDAPSLEPFYGPKGGYLDGRGDAACIGHWATQNLEEIIAECAKGVRP